MRKTYFFLLIMVIVVPSIGLARYVLTPPGRVLPRFVLTPPGSVLPKSEVNTDSSW